MNFCCHHCQRPTTLLRRRCAACKYKLPLWYISLIALLGTILALILFIILKIEY